MTKNFFIGEGPEAEALIAEVKELREAANNARDVVQKEYGADGLVLHEYAPVGWYGSRA